MKHISDPTHPIWPMIRHGISMGALLVILLLTASRFDDTEIRTLCLMFLIGGSSEALTNVLGRFTRGERERGQG